MLGDIRQVKNVYIVSGYTDMRKGTSISFNDKKYSDSLLPSLKGYAIQDELRLQLMNWGEYTVKIMPQFIS